MHTTGESLVVTGAWCLNLSGSVIKLISFTISSAVRKGYKSPPSNILTDNIL